MDTSHHQQHQQNTKERSSSTTDNQQQQPSTTAAAAAAVSSSSSSSSPSHEFSFAISLNNNTMINTDKAKIPPSSSSSSSIAIDLTPADDIFFHGHLLPLHLLSHLSTISPRSSTDSFTTTRPVPTSKSDSNIKSTNHGGNNNIESTTRSKKSKSFSLFSFNKRQQKRVVEDEHKEKNNKRKKRFDVSDVLKRYLKMVKPLLFFKGKRRDTELYHVHRQAYSFSGNLSTLRNRKSGDHHCSSAPVSMRTSPTNSGLLVSTTSDSTMEELQAAIQAAIAHCKNSIRGEDKLQC